MHEIAQSQTLPDLLVEFYEDYFTKNPSEARKVRSKGGDFFFEETGDPLIDKWERELQSGITPDLEEGLSQKEKEKLRKEREKVRTVKEQTKNDKTEDERYQSKKVAIGSREEAELLKGRILGSPLPKRQNISDEDWEDLLRDLT